MQSRAVSILVIVDVALKGGLGPWCRWRPTVSILVIVDVALKAYRSVFVWLSVAWVSILVIVDVALKATHVLQ